MRPFQLLLALAFLAPLHQTPAQTGGPWPAEVPGHVPPEPGEHPRLFFRRADLPALRAKAQTPGGQAILARLKQTLGGGEGMPLDHRPKDAPFGDRSQRIDLPEGAYSIGHAAGFGLLYQLTGEQKYADWGRKCFEWAFEGIRDRDSSGRYGWKGSSGALRAGPSLGWYAVAYDLLYDGWDPEFRVEVAQAIQNYNQGPNTSLAELARGARHNPRSNHWGMQVGGGALAALAIMNDPGVDMNRLNPILEASQRAMIRNMTDGFGDGGFFAEGDGTGSMSSHIVFLPALQAWRVAGGKDFTSPRPNAQWMAMRWMFLSQMQDGKADFWPQRGGYPHNIWNRADLSGAGYFAYGFGVLRQEYLPGLSWIYNTSFLEADQAKGAPFDTISVYPHVSVLAFINWPVNLQAENPAGIWPHAFRDSKYGFYAWRNLWRDEDDVIISILTRTARGFMRANGENTLSIHSGGRKFTWGRIQNGFTGDFEPKADGSTILVTGDGSSLAIDFSRASGKDAVLVMTGPGAPRENTVEAGGRFYSLIFLGKGEAPTPRVEGDRVHIGNQTVGFENGRITLAR